MDQFRIIERPVIGAGCCFITRTSIGPFVQLDVDSDDWYGWPNGPLYVATSWIEDAAKTLGMLPKDAAEEAKSEVEALKAERDELAKRVAELENAVEAMSRVGFREPVAVEVEAVKRSPGRPRKDAQ